jgi:hypothetical protein
MFQHLPISPSALLVPAAKAGAAKTITEHNRRPHSAQAHLCRRSAGLSRTLPVVPPALLEKNYLFHHRSHALRNVFGWKHSLNPREEGHLLQARNAGGIIAENPSHELVVNCDERLRLVQEIG